MVVFSVECGVKELLRDIFICPAGDTAAPLFTLHFISRSTLSLLMLGVLADHHDFTLALDDLALFAHGLNTRSDFH